MLALAVATTLVAATPPMKLASPGWQYVNVDEKKGDFFSDYFAQQLAIQGLSVTTKSEISSLLGLERQRELLGCSPQASSCAAELAGALGVDALIVGSLARFKAGYTVTVKIVAARDGQQLAVDAGKVKDDDALVEWLQSAAARIAPKLVRPATPQPPAPAAQQPVPSAAVSAQLEPSEAPASSGPRWAVILPAAAGAVFAGAGTYALVRARGIDADLRRPDSPYWNAEDPEGSVRRSRDAASEGALFQTVGFAGLGVAAAAAATSVVFALQPGSGDPDASVSASVAPGAAAVSMAVRF